MYAIYFNDIERFILVEEDLWLTLHACRLLSSKFSIFICSTVNNEHITNETCYLYNLSTTELPTFSQYPRLIDVNLNFEHVGLHLGVPLETILEKRKFCQFVIKVLKAAWMTDSILNVADSKFFQTLLEIKEIESEHDFSGIPTGFIKSIERILYLSESEEEILEKIDSLLNDSNSYLPGALAQYKKTFYKYFKS
jgi:hypothetical protein